VPRAPLRGVFNEFENLKDRPADWGHACSKHVAGYRWSEQEVMMQ